MIYVLCLYVLGIVIKRHCGQSQITHLLSELMGCKFGTMKQGLRESMYEAQAKRGDKRQEIDVCLCLRLYSVGCDRSYQRHKQVVLALDVTYLTNRFTILAVSEESR